MYMDPNSHLIASNLVPNTGLNVASNSMGTTGIVITKNELNDIDKEKEKQARYFVIVLFLFNCLNKLNFLLNQLRENHCEIERRRRVKMAAYFSELCSMVPTCNTLQRKPDKLTILRMASSHMKQLRNYSAGNNLGGSGVSSHQMVQNDNSYKPSFLTDQELKYLILEVSYFLKF